MNETPKTKEWLTFWLLFFTYTITCLFSVLDYIYLDRGANYNFVFGLTFLVIFIIGNILRFITIRQLGKFFHLNVKIHEDHKIIQHGLYKYVRHPMYFANFLIFAGVAGVFNSLTGVFLATFLIIPALVFRIKQEEKYLIEKFNDDYKKYMAKTKLFIPFILVLTLFLTGCLGAQEQLTESTGIILEKPDTFNSHFGAMHPEHNYSEVYNLGIRWERPHPGPFIWDEIEEEEGEYNWGETDEWILEAQANGFNTAPTIWPYADWDQETCHGDEELIKPLHFHDLPERRHKPCDEQKYKKFITTLIERYDGDGENDMQGLKYPVLVYEISNEPTMQGGDNEHEGQDLYFFKGSVQDYVDTLKWSYEAIKETNSEVLVSPAGMAGTDGDVTKFWQEAIDLDADNYADLWSFHNIGQDNEYLLADEAMEFFNKNNIDKPIWLPENEYRYEKERDGDLSQAASDMIKSHCRAFSLGVDKIFLTSIQTDQQPPKTNNLDARFAGNDEAITAYSEFVAAIDYFTSVEKINEEKFIFTMPDTSQVEISWENNSKPQIKK